MEDTMNRDRREKEKIELTEKIQQSAIQIIVKEGFDKLSMRKIALDIQYSPTTIYSYFDNKEAIIRSIASDIYNQIIKNVQTSYRSNKDKSEYEILEAIIRTFISTMLKEPQTIQAVLQSSYNMFEEGEADPRHKELDDFLMECSKKGILKRTSEDTKLLLIVNILGFVSFVSNRDTIKTIKREQLINDFIQNTLFGLCGRE